MTHRGIPALLVVLAVLVPCRAVQGQHRSTIHASATVVAGPALDARTIAAVATRDSVVDGLPWRTLTGLVAVTVRTVSARPSATALWRETLHAVGVRDGGSPDDPPGEVTDEVTEVRSRRATVAIVLIEYVNN